MTQHSLASYLTFTQVACMLSLVSFTEQFSSLFNKVDIDPNSI